MVPASALLAPAAAGSVARAGKVKPDFSFYSGKTITFIVPQVAGGSDYPMIINTQQGVENYLHATINIESIPQGNTVTGQNDLAAAPPDGLTIGFYSVPADSAADIENTPFVNFQIQKEALIAGTPLPEYVVVACEGSQFTSFQQVIKDHSSFNALVSSVGPTQMLEASLLHAYGIEPTLVSGYSNTAGLVQGCMRGDGQIAVQPVAQFTPLELVPGVLRPLLQIGVQPKGSDYYSDLKNVPTLASLSTTPPKTPGGKEVLKLLQSMFGPGGIGLVVGAPAGTSPGKILALTDAFHSALAQKNVIASLIAAGFPPGYIAPSTVPTYLKELLKHSPLINRFVNQ